MSYITVIGGINMDIKGLPQGEVLLHNSNPASIYYSPGGVARNIAENLGRLNVPTILLGAVGGDPMGEQVLRETAKVGVDTQFAKCESGYSTGVDISFLNDKGDLHLAYCDMKVVNTVDISYLEKHQKLLSESRFIIADANIPASSIAWLADFAHQQKVSLIVEPCSFQHSTKLHEVQSPIFLITPNEQEWELINQEQAFTHYENLLITKGEKGAVLINENGQQEWPAFPAKVVDTIGAGDALVAGVAYGLFQGLDLTDAIPYGLAAGAVTVESRETVSEVITVLLNRDHKRFGL